jgi:hypothetical protein
MGKRYYRINESFKLIGAFWRPEEREAAFTGTLTARKGRVELVTAPSYLPELGREALRDSLLRRTRRESRSYMRPHRTSGAL